MKRSTWRNIAIIIAVIIAVIAMFVVVVRRCDTKLQQLELAHKASLTTPERIGLKLVRMGKETGSKCARMSMTEEECPVPTGDAARRIIATMMTQSIEFRGRRETGNRYVAERIVALNHVLYDLIQRLEQRPCQPIGHVYISEKALQGLRHDGFIHQCGTGWSLNSEWVDLIGRTDSAER